MCYFNVGDRIIQRKEGGMPMKPLYLKISGMLAALALLVSTANVNATCICWVHQPKLPDNAQKLRRF